MGTNIASAAVLTATDTENMLDLGFAYSTGADGFPLDLVTAHQWFNLAALSGSTEAQHCRADIAHQMTRQEIVEAQRRARTWLAAH